MDPCSEMITEVKFDVEELAASTHIPKSELRNMSLRSGWDAGHDNLVMLVRQLALKRSYVTQEELTHKTKAYPATWWDAVKARFLPRGLRGGYLVKPPTFTSEPVQIESHINYIRLCPHVEVRDREPHYAWLMSGKFEPYEASLSLAGFDLSELLEQFLKMSAYASESIHYSNWQQRWPEVARLYEALRDERTRHDTARLSNTSVSNSAYRRPVPPAANAGTDPSGL